MSNATYLFIPNRRPIDTGKERTECTFVGFTSQMQSQSISSSVASQVITLLRTHNISAPGTENTSGKYVLVIQCLYQWCMWNTQGNVL